MSPVTFIYVILLYIPLISKVRKAMNTETDLKQSLVLFNLIPFFFPIVIYGQKYIKRKSELGTTRQSMSAATRTIKNNYYSGISPLTVALIPLIFLHFSRF